MTIIQLLAVILIGGPTVMLGVFLLARSLVYRHADQYGPAIRAAGRDDANEATVRAVSRELVR